jgi:hypothetical protein
MKTRLLPIAIAGSLLISSLQAQIVVESFDYATGALNNTATNGTGQTGNWRLTPTNAGNATLSVANITWATPTGYTISPNNKGVGGVVGATGAFFLNSAIDFDVDGEVFFSMLYRRPTNSGSIGLISLNSGNTEKARLLQTSGGGAITGSIGDTLSGTGNSFPGTGDLLIVGRIVTSASGNDTLALQITGSAGTVPVSFTATTGVASAATTGTANSIYFWNFANADSTGAYFGEFRMGDSYASVIPEPSTYALLIGSLGLALAYCRRRQGKITRSTPSAD